MNDKTKTDFAGAYTFVYWSLKDCPIPSDLHPISVENNIRQALVYLGYYSGSVKFRFYGKDGEDVNVHQMLFHIIACTSSFYPEAPTNLVVFSKTIPKNSEFFRVLCALRLRGSNVLLVQPPESASESMFQTAESVRACTKLLDGGNSMIRNTICSNDAASSDSHSSETHSDA